MKSWHETFIFIDESGDSTFFGKRKKNLVGTDGFQPMLNLGMIKLKNKSLILNAIRNFVNSIRQDPLYNSIASIKDPNWYLHAKDDHPEVRAKFFEFIRKLKGFEAYVVIGRKHLSVFQKKHNQNQSEFYFDLVHHLLKGTLRNESHTYKIYLAARRGNTKKFLSNAIENAIANDNNGLIKPKKIVFHCEIVRNMDTPELYIVDYLLWAINRYISKGEERFFKAIIDKYKLIIDLYDLDENSGQPKLFNKRNPFSVQKVGEFRTDGYV